MFSKIHNWNGNPPVILQPQLDITFKELKIFGLLLQMTYLLIQIFVICMLKPVLGTVVCTKMLSPLCYPVL